MRPITLRLAAVLLATAPAAFAQVSNEFVELHSWYSPSRGDNFATTDPGWQGGPGQQRSPDYDFVRYEGWVFDPARPQPPGTVPLHAWYSPSRADNVTTSDPSWIGGPGQRRSPDYLFVRHEGYVFDPALPQPPGTVALHSWYSPSRGDNFITSDPTWHGGPGQRRSPDYVFVRAEGYIIDPGRLIDLAPGCGWNGGPVLQAGSTSHVVAGLPYQLVLGNQPPGASGAAFLLMNVQRLRFPIGLDGIGMPGCRLHVMPMVSLPFIRTLTTQSVHFPVPRVPGASLYMQGVLFDPGANAAGLAMSNAVVAVIRR